MENWPAREEPAGGDRTRPTFTLYTAQELRDLPAPSWLIPDLLQRDSLAVLAGPPGSFKSYLALDWALSIAAAVRWCGRPPMAGLVVYVAGEGYQGLGQRIAAWEKAHGWDAPARCWFVPDVPR